MAAAAAAEDFLSGNPEDGDLNQYWYSTRTIARIVEDLTKEAGADGVIAFLSTPSLYFSMPEDVRNRSFVLDYDKKWASDRGFVFYDFNDPTGLPAHLLGKCDMVVIDPPFITHEVWRKYAESSKLLLRSGGKALGTTIFENAELLQELLQLKPTNFQPSIPNLVYQYRLYTSYPSDVFAAKNPEIPE
jgi:hypothetical protein